MTYLYDRYKTVITEVVAKLKSAVYEPVAPLETVCWKTAEPVPYSERTSGEYMELKIGDTWGELFDCAWFRFRGQVPQSCRGKKAVLVIDVNGEGLIFDDNGVPVRGITCFSVNFDKKKGSGKRIYIIADEAEGNEKIDIWMDAGCNDLVGQYKDMGRLHEAHIAICHETTRQAYYDTVILADLLDAIDEKSADYKAILYGIYEASRKLRTYSDEEIEEYGRAVRALYRTGGGSYLTFTAIGHAHIDLAFLWPIRETRRKGARTFATALELMDRYPEYKFGASQPQLYQWIKEDHPALYEKIKQKVAEGRWEAQGCMWVEADTNLSGGESLVRQIIHGKRFFKDEFGVDVRHLWLPDVFGYCASLPQILKKSGCDYFMTQKLSWNWFNKFPHHTFMWQGIDGTEIFATMLPEDTYNGPFYPTFIKHAERNYADSPVADEALMLFGIGDGGGGPGPEHLERYRRVKDLKGLTAINIDLAEPMFERLEEKTRGKLRTWSGELYLERHQGTYTSQAKNKYYNRKSEFALREAEFALELCGEENYPREELDRIWKEILLYQFHDIIPGSSIKRVYDESCARYVILLDDIEKIIASAYRKAADGRRCAFNSLSWDRDEIVSVGGREYRVSIPALGYTTEFADIDTSALRAYENTIENENLKAVFDSDGALISLVDKRNGKESLGEKSNVYNVYEDTNGDCWDINILYLDKVPERFILTDSEIKIDGSRAVCRQKYSYNLSTLTAEISLAAGDDILKIELHVDWHENEKMLRIALNTNIVSDHTSFEIPYGKICRQNNDNTMLQQAQFEVCGHKWADLSQSDRGVALLNDCKYGFRAIGKTIDMNLLRSQNCPGIGADRGEHDIVYAIYPHSGNDASGDVAKRAYELNSPVRVVDGTVSHGDGQLFTPNGNIIVESVKRAEMSENLIIRAYEPYGGGTDASFDFGREVKVTECDLLENPVAESKITRRYDREFKPFEIVTLLIERI